ncbi:maestro heat-like repeat-containing protein family member 1 isoform X1 [Schistocerca americana]|uniref:maestro heat-like repeat-containing protein family member 1 isoform X1 n=1 Tax=Schistocerca americana TaxID=7009 RepID=UPI001F4F38FC|nr:maestro heat-like repeat-containing protein family member 1 isoform X1 [Schistocerca americana]
MTSAMDINAKNSSLQVVIGSLVEAAGDKNETVRHAVSESLKKIARKHQNDVLDDIICYCKRNSKLPLQHLSLLLKTIENICQEHLSNINEVTVSNLIEFAMEEMTRNSDYIPESQMPLSGVLVALGKIHCNQVMEGILKQFQPGVLPHYCILHTMGNLASANVFGIVPFIKATLGTMLPMLGMVRNDALKQAFAFALGRFGDAILEYMANIDTAPDNTVKKDSFSTEISIAYDVLVSSWINSREPKVCEAVLQALGPMFSILETDKVFEQLPRLIPILLNLYRRNVDSYAISQCLAAVLLVAVEHSKSCLELHADNLLNVLFEMVCPFPDYAQPAAVKNHYEVLRCFDRIATACVGKVLEFMIHQLKNGEREKIKALFVISHLVNSSENVIQSKISDVIVIMKNLLSESSGKVKKAVLKTIVALAYKGHLNGETGMEFIEYIVRNSRSSSTDQAANYTDSENVLEDLSHTCASTLYLLTTTVSEVEGTLWPLLMKCYLLSEYTTACTPIARCLAHLSSKDCCEKMLSGGMGNEHTHKVPHSFSLFGRSLALLGNPSQTKRGIYILSFMKNIAKMINPHLCPLWEQKIPDLISYLKESTFEIHDQVWDELLLEFVSSTLTEVDEEKWTLEMGEQLKEQLTLYTSYPIERGMAFKMLAVTTCHTTDKLYVGRVLDVIFTSLRQYSASDSKHCSKAVGICSRNHLSIVLPKLEGLRKEELSRRSSRLLSFMKDIKHEGEQERIRLTLLQCYGEVALEAPSTELMPRMEQNVLQWVVQQIQMSKDASVTDAALRALGKIAEGFHPNRNSLQIMMQNRTEVLNLIISQLNTDCVTLSPLHLMLMTTVLRVAAIFIKLPPALAPQERISVLKHCFTKVYHVILLDSKSVQRQPDTASDELLTENSGITPEIEDLQSALGMLVQEMLLISVCPSTLDEMFTLLEPWISQKYASQRTAALDTLSTILHCYISNVRFGCETPTKFSQTGIILGRIAPRCTDPDLKVRQKATDCVYLVLCLAARYEGHSKDYENEFTNHFNKVQNELQTDDPQRLFKATGDLAQIVCSKLPQFQVIPFTDSLLDGLMDAEPSSSSGASVILNVFLKIKGGELYHQVNEILNGILKQLSNVHYVQTRNGGLRAILALAHHHPKSVVSALLLQRLPYDLSVSECWMVLAQDPVLSSDIIEQFLSIISTTPLYEIQNDKVKIAALLPLAAISAMSNMFSIASMSSITVKKFPELFSMFLVAMGCYVGISPPICVPQKPENTNKYGIVPNRGAYKLNPAKVTQDAFKAFLLCSNCELIAEALLQCTHMDSGENLTAFIKMIPGLVKKVCQCVPQSLPKLVGCFNQYGTSNYEPQRITVAAFYAELMAMRGSLQMVLMESIMSNLLNCLADPSPVVRQLCLKGLASLSCWEQEQVNRHSECVLSALLQGLDDQENGSKIPFEAMKGFIRMLKVADDTQIENIQVTIALRIKPYFEKDDPELRATAIQIFGDIARYGNKPSKTPFLEQINGNLACFFLHLNDDHEMVIKACKYTLKQVCPWLQTEKLNSMCQEHLHNESVLYYTNFISAVSKILVDDLKDLMPLLIMNTLSYLKSSWPRIRGNAAMLIGLLSGNLPLDLNNSIPLDTVCSRLLQSLKDENQEVRAKAAEALSSLFIS